MSQSVSLSDAASAAPSAGPAELHVIARATYNGRNLAVVATDPGNVATFALAVERKDKAPRRTAKLSDIALAVECGLLA